MKLVLYERTTVATSRYDNLDRYLRSHDFDAQVLDDYFSQPHAWANIARIISNSLDSLDDTKEPIGHDVILTDALEPWIAGPLLRWSYAGKRMKVLGDITRHPRKRIAQIPGIDSFALERIDTALTARRLEYAPSKGK